MRLLQHITESFNRPYKYKFDSDNMGEKYTYYFETNYDKRYIVTASLGCDYGGSKLEDIVGKKIDIYLDNNNPYFNFYDIQFYLDTNSRNKKDSVGILGTGDAQRIFATVLVIMKDFLKREDNPQIIVFMASEKSRKKLYDRMVKTFVSKFGYKWIGSYTNSLGKEYVLWNGEK